MHAVSRDKYLQRGGCVSGELFTESCSLINHVKINSFDFDSNIFDFLAIRLFNLTKYLIIMINYNINIGVIDDILLFESVIINLTILRKCNEIFLTSDQRWSFVKRRNWTLSVFFFFFLLLSIYGFSNILLSPSELSSQVLMWIMNKSI